MFNNSKRFTIKGSTVNNIGRDQINNTTFNVETLHCNGEIATKRTEYDEFEYVKLGHVIPSKEICSVDITEWKQKNGKYYIHDRKTQRKMYSIEVFGQQSRFTAVEYRGKEAKEVWEEDFQKFSRDRDPNSWLLYGLNHSKVPMLIFHHDLIPLAHFFTESLWENLYFWWLMKQLGCYEDQVWMDTSKGVFCVGPDGPFPPFAMPQDRDLSITTIVPSTIDMLNADIIFSFFRQFNSKELHQELIYAATLLYKFQRCDSFLGPTLSPEASEEEQLNLQSFFPGLPCEQLRSSLLGLRLDTVYSTSLDAVARWPQEAMEYRWELDYGLVDQTSVGELTRFTMCGDDIYVCARSDIVSQRECWLLQFPRCMEEGNAEDYFFIGLQISLVPGSSREYEGLACFFKLCDGEIPPPIYLFLYPPTPMTISGLISWSKGHTHFWSLDENGQSEMTENELEQWRVPRLVLSGPYIWLIYWDSSIYTALYDWQVAHGFDPNTADFARHLDIPELEILRPKKEKSSSWWEAAPGISAFGF